MNGHIFYIFPIVIVIGVLLTLDMAIGQPNRNQIENFANLAEKISDRQHTKYCERFGNLLSEKSEIIWPQVNSRCIERMVRDGAELPSNFPKIDADMRKKIVTIFERCGPIVHNPCIPQEWVAIKHCIRDQAFNTKLLELNGTAPFAKECTINQSWFGNCSSRMYR
ncbi:hypothetical protein DERF_004569 [Dermatophagoides farinae]|uniref:Uncharacterized protein n=1 Tax=Dermatophagoides farinae TaxID=6954 RepID=A0A922LA87_DERFA|nr:hypothetical protein DERF_004569 [Dermatophagoides farinae]